MLFFRLALRFLWREAKSGELTLIFAALLLAVTSATAIALFSARLDGAMQLRSNEFLGADLRIESTVPIDQFWRQQADKIGLQSTQTVHFPTVVLVGDEMAMASAKVVEKGYPLKSKLLVAHQDNAAPELKNTAPNAGEAWLDQRLLIQLDAKLNDRIEVGNTTLTITGIIYEESDRSAGFYSFSPRLMFHADDLAASGLVSVGSRIRWRLLVKGEPEQIAAFQALTITHPLSANQKLQTLKNSNEMLANRLANAQRYLGLAAMLAVILAAVAVAISAKQYSLRHFDISALLRTFGLSRAQITRLYLLQLLLLGSIATALGLILALGLQAILLEVLDQIVPKPLPQAPLSAWLLGASVGLITLFGFALPHLLPLAKVSPLRVLRRDLDPVPLTGWLLSLLALSALTVLLYLFTQDLPMTLAVMGGGMIFVVGLLCLLMGIIRALKVYFRNKALPLSWRFAWLHFAQNSGHSAGQIIAFSLTLMVMVLISSLRTDLLADWQQGIEKNTPNVFAINIQLDELTGFKQSLADLQLSEQKFYQTVPGRLLAINQQPIAGTEQGKISSIDRDLILTADTELPKDNQITAGDWQAQNQRGQVSVESKLAEKLALKLGDKLEFQIAGKTIQATVSSFRSVDWSSLTPNFFMIFSPDLFQDVPTTLMTSFHYTDNRHLTQLIRAYPTVTFMDVKAVLEQIQSLLEQVTMAIELILIFVLLAALLVMLASLITGIPERLKEGAILRTLGVQTPLLRRAQFYEFMALALTSALFALLGAEAIRFSLYSNLLNLTWHNLGLAWLYLPVLALLLLAASGMWLLRPAIKSAPLTVLRELS